MPRINRLRRARSTNVLTFHQELELIAGCTSGFSDRTEMERAWRQHRERLMADCAPFQRPHAFWVFEAKREDSRGGQKDAIIELNILTPEERSLALGESPHWFPEVIPIGAVDHWETVPASIEIRAAWHTREGRPEQARAWREQGDALKEKILEVTEKRSN